MNPILQKHVQIIQTNKAARAKLATIDFVTELHKIDADFRAFASTGIAAKISSLQSCYAMYVNSLDRQPAKCQQIISQIPQVNDA